MHQLCWRKLFTWKNFYGKSLRKDSCFLSVMASGLLLGASRSFLHLRIHPPDPLHPSPPPPLDSGGLLILELLLTSPNSWSWTNRVVINIPSCKLNPGERGLWGSGPICFSLKLLRGKHMLCAVPCRDGRWCLLGTGCSFGKVRVAGCSALPVGLTVSAPAAPAVKQAPPHEKKHGVNAEQDTFLHFFDVYTF